VLSVTKVGGGSSISPARRASSASAGVIQRCAWISPPSTRTGVASARPRKNQVAKRLGMPSGVVQCEICASASGSSSSPASSRASRAAARRAAPGAPPSPASPASIRPPGKTQAPPWKASFELRRRSRTSSASRASRTSTTVAAGAASLMTRV